AALQQALVFAQPEQLVHHPAAVPQISNGLEQRDDVDVQPTVPWSQDTYFLEEQRDLQNVRDTVGLGDDVVGHCLLAVSMLRFRGSAQDRQLGRRLRGIRKKRAGKWPRRLQFLPQEGDARVLAQRSVSGTWPRHLE